MKIHLRQFLQTLEMVAVPVLVAAGVPPAVAGDLKAGMILAEKVADGTSKNSAEKKSIALDSLRVGIQAANDIKPGSLDAAQVMDLGENAIDTTIKTVNLIHGKN